MSEQPDPATVTQILARLRDGQAGAVDELLPLVYDQLRAVARGQLARERPGHTLQATALIHEAWLKLGDVGDAAPQDRAHFLALAARAMRQILVDHARRKKAGKRGGDWGRVTLDAALGHLQRDEVDVLDVDEALERLAAFDPRRARVVELRYFGGLTMPEIAEALGVSQRTAEGDWFVARAWLRKELAAG